jgi:hypothetical protein
VHESPVRVHDSRSEPQRELVVGETRTVDLQLPAGARAALVIVTVDQTEGSGYLTLYAADTPLPATNIDWSETGEVIATSSTVNVDDEGRINITAGHDATHFIVGVTGYVM